jgi:hypothetical protein
MATFTSVEIALVGLAAAYATTALRRAPALPVLGALYFALSGNVGPRTVAALVMAAAYGAARLWRPVRAAPVHGFFVKGLLAFFASAPLFAVMTEADGRMEPTDYAAVALFVVGAALMRQRRAHGETLLAWSFYVLALGVPNGFVTLFAPLILMRRAAAADAAADVAKRPQVAAAGAAEPPRP